MKRSNIWDWAFTPHFIYLVLEKRPNYHVCKSDGGIAACFLQLSFCRNPLEKQMGILGACLILWDSSPIWKQNYGKQPRKWMEFCYYHFQQHQTVLLWKPYETKFSILYLRLVDAVLLLDTGFWCFRLCLVMKVMKIMVGSEARQRPPLVWVLAVKATVIWPWDRWDSKDIYVGLHPKAKDDKEANPENPDSTPDGRTKRQNSMMRSKFLVSSPTSFQFIRV